MLSFIIIATIVLCILLGYKTKINTGFFAIVASYIIGCFIMGMKGKEVIATWPISIFFIIFSVSLFYNIAITNGTLDILSQHLLYKSRKKPQLLPFAIFLGTTLVAGLGAGYYTAIALFGPITILLCNKTGLKKLVGAVAVNCGALVGGNFMTSSNGIVFKNLIEETGIVENGYGYASVIFVTTLIISLIILSLLLFLDRKSMKQLKELDIDKPDSFNDKQKKTIYLILTMVLVVLGLPTLKILLPNVEAIAYVNSKIDIALLAFVFTVIGLLMNLASEKEIVAKVPWNTLIMISGVGMLIAIAIEAGTIDLLAGWIGTNVPVNLVPIALCVIGGFMSFFSSTIGVVTPTLFPMVPALAASTGLDPAILFTAIVAGAQATSISPFSSGGSLLLGSCDESEKDEMFSQMMFIGAPSILAVTTILVTIVALVLL